MCRHDGKGGEPPDRSLGNGLPEEEHDGQNHDCDVHETLPLIARGDDRCLTASIRQFGRGGQGFRQGCGHLRKIFCARIATESAVRRVNSSTVVRRLARRATAGRFPIFGNDREQSRLWRGADLFADRLAAMTNRKAAKRSDRRRRWAGSDAARGTRTMTFVRDCLTPWVSGRKKAAETAALSLGRKRPRRAKQQSLAALQK